MVSIRFENRALPVLWTIVDTNGAIGFDVQEKVLDQLLEIIPPEVDVLLAADRFYGTKNSVEWRQKAGWHYRVRLKGNLIFQYEGKNITAKDVGKLPESKAIEAKFNESNIQANLGYLHEDGHDEAWIIAMDCDPSRETILDYGQRWGIECMFADLKSRGFSVTETHLRDVERLEKLLLILAIALYWGASVGLAEEAKERYTEKKQNRSKRSFLTKGLAIIFSMIVSSTFFHELWAHVPWIT
ncbi:hypothetical protein FACS1894122_11620 [Alphaproteobacteria bacterium]|nr:hypothetical protein FACS1894122_11620 [Alphaproteobacteria bacterium]